MSAYMKPRMIPSSKTWGKMPTRSGRSMRQGGSRVGGGAASHPDRLLLGRGSGDGQALDFLVVAPLLGVVAGHLKHEVEGLLGIALVVELDGAGDAGVLHLADGGRDVLPAGHLSALGRRLDALEGDGGSVVGLGSERL